MNDKLHEALSAILAAVPDSAIGLPGWITPADDEVDFAEKILVEVELEIGAAAESDYYKTSRERFAAMIVLARRNLPANAKLLDIGNAPGFLALALHKCGYQVCGLNLSDEWISTYPNPHMAVQFDVKSCDIEQAPLPYADGSFDALIFTEVLEHIAIKHPKKLLPEFKRKLKTGGLVLFSTPNVCNLSNLMALMIGLNVFWAPEIFYGSTDRHNREYTPTEVKNLFAECGFECLDFFGINDHANWRTGSQDLIYPFLESNPGPHALLRNTIVGVFAAGR